jgi:hypothetical protein
MNSKLALALRKRFELELSRRLPFFTEVETQTGPERWRRFQWRASDALVFSIILVIPQLAKGDRFTVEIGWSSNGDFPGVLGPSDEPSESGPNGVRFRISKLWSHRDWWWWLGPEQTLETALQSLDNEDYLKPEDLTAKTNDIEPKVLDALKMIELHALPYFRAVAERHGGAYCSDALAALRHWA